MTTSLLRLLSLLLFATLTLAARAAATNPDTSYHVVYTGGTLHTIPLGTGVKLYIDSTLLRIVDDRLDALTIPVTAITGVSTTPLTSLISLGHVRSHTLAITWSYNSQRGGLALRCTAAEYQGILAALEGVSNTR